MLPEQQQRIMGYFIEEAKDHLNTIEQGLLNLQATIQDGDKANELFRAAHSVKGGAAMLGLESIQRTAHRLEDYFKLLKESPVQVDRALETMFLRISDGLKDLLEQLEGPFGLTQDKAQEIMADVEPVFGQLEQHLESLVGESGGLGADSGNRLSAKETPAESDVMQTSFKQDVAALLRQMLATFKHSDNAESRKTLQTICSEFVAIGEQFDLAEWRDLSETARIAVGNLNNDYRKLAPIVIKEIKKAQDMVLSGRASEVAVSDAMQSLLPEDVLIEGVLTEEASIEESSAVLPAVEEGVIADEPFGAEADEQTELADLFGASDELDLDSLDEPSVDDEFDGLFDSGLDSSGADESHSISDVSASNIDGETDELLAEALFSDVAEPSVVGQTAADDNDDESNLAEDDLEPVNRLSVELEFDEIPSELSALNRDAESEEKADESLDALLATVNVTGPDVGSEELNSLADLFDGDLDELDNTLGGHAFISEEMRSNPEGIESAAEDDLTDLFADETADDVLFDSTSDETELEEDNDLFGGTLTDGEFAVLDDSFIDEADLQSLSASEAVASKETNSEAVTSGAVVSEETANLANDFAELSEDVWGEEASPSENADNSPSEMSAFELELANSDNNSDSPNLDELTLESSLDDLDLDALSIDDDMDGLLDFPSVSLDESDDVDEGGVDAEADEQPLSVDEDEQAEALSLTEALVAQSAEPRELHIEFPTFTGIELEEAEQAIDSFFVEGDEAAGDDSDLWSEGLTGAPVHIDDESAADLETPAVDADLKIEQAGSELDDLLTAAADPVSAAPALDVEADDLSDDLWSDLETSSNVSEQTAVAAIDEEFSETAVDSDGNDSGAVSVESVESAEAIEVVDAADSLEDLFVEDTGNEADTGVDGNELSLDDLTIGMVDDAGDRSSSLDSEPDVAASHSQTISEDDLLDFDTAFGFETIETEETVSRDAVPQEGSSQPDSDSAEMQDLPTFSGDLDEFADAADGETTISDIASLRIEDAELDSLLGLDFAVDTGDRNRKDLPGKVEQPADEIDSSVLEAFSDIDDLFDEDESIEEHAESELTFENTAETDEDEFFNASSKTLSSEMADEIDLAEFDDLDALLADEEEPAGASNQPTLVSVNKNAVSGSDAEEEDFGDLERLLEDGEAESDTSVRRVAARPARRGGGIREQNMRVSVKHLDNLSNLVGELVVSRNTLERDQERLRQFLDNLLFQVQQLNDVGQRLRDLYERSLLESSLMSNKRTAAPANGGGEVTAEENDHATGAIFDALEMDRFTGFHSLSQEMIELIVRVRESSSDIGYTVESSDQVTRQFRQITTQLQEGLNTARMVAFSQAADRLPRAVRDISLKCGKEARLVVEGQDTLIDKMIVEHLYDPLTHLVNNAITHGIELPEERVAAGKPSEGKITVRAFYQGNQTVIYVADDGGGINTKFVQRKAVEKNLISQAEADNLSDLETYDLLFHPGFSTRDQADDFAGRGVGMDVVRTSLAEIRGSITIDSEMGRGTSFTIRLPLTLSISKALSCVSAQARIAFPMDGVEDMLDVPRDRVVQNEQGQDCVRWRETLLPFQPVTDLLKFNRTMGRGRVYGGSQDDEVLSVIVLRSANTYVAVQVDQVIGEEEIVIKQLEGPVPKPLGIAGATVLGDGRVMPIADVIELIDIAMGRVRRESSSMMWAQEGMAAVEETPVKSEPTVLIVDDSITVRELLSMSFNKVGYRVEQARDGQEAWDKLRSGLPCDLVFCDIEMPRMDGLELLSRMQKDSQLKRVPIAMLTSRGADRHRQMAVDLGASGYFTKPYLEEALLDAAQRMLNGETLEKGRGG